MLAIEAILLIGPPILLLSFLVLSSPRLKMPGAVRMAFGMLAVYIAVLGALWLECGPWALLCIAVAAAVASLAIQGEGLSRLTEALGRRRLPLYLLSVATLAGLVYLFVPITTFLTSPGELDIHLDHLRIYQYPTPLFNLGHSVHTILFTGRRLVLERHGRAGAAGRPNRGSVAYF